MVTLGTFGYSSMGLNMVFHEVTSLHARSSLLVPTVFTLYGALLYSLSSGQALVLGYFLFSDTNLPPFFLLFFVLFLFDYSRQRPVNFKIAGARPYFLPVQ